MFTNLRRIIRSGFINFKRSGSVSFSSVLVMTITLCVFVGLIFSQSVLFNTLEQIKKQVDVTVYFNTDAKESAILSLKSAIEKLPEVDSSVYVSAEEALKRFQDKHSGDYLTLQALEELGDNPLGAELNIKAKDVAHYESISNFLDKESVLTKGETSIINKIDYRQNKEIISRLNSITNNARLLGLIVSGVLVLLSVIIVYNTIRLTIYISRDEIKVMRLVGATRRYIGGPFIVEGIIYGFLSAVLAMIVFYPVSLWLGNNMAGFFGLNLYNYYLANFFQIFVIILGAGVVLGAFSSFLAILRYINK